MALVIFLEVLLALFCFLLLYRSRNNDESFPKSFPFVGMMPELLLNIHRVHDWCTETLERCRATYPKDLNLKRFDILGDGFFKVDMDFWKKKQRLIAQASIKHQLFHKHLLRTNRAKVEKGRIPVIEHAAKQGLVVNLEDIFQRFTLDSVCILVTGYDPSCLALEPPRVRFSEAVDDATEAIFDLHVRPECFIKLQKWLNMGQERKYRKAWEVLDDVIAKYICRKREEQSKINNEDGVDLLTPYINEEKSGGFKHDDKFLRDTILTMMVAGRDTVGPRACLGKEMTFVQMKAVASAIVYDYRIHVSEKTPVVCSAHHGWTDVQDLP
ncbi:Detected protein of unknown function [Hibiscus syriacus]|uniref:Cytochrome P450 n=1 Tax=Hibiscus syriacus TaxID=106335 RepID=A0A6A3B4G9_HIBSY|nr:Detected protein of unknown function [Hibiscus syriacus]